MEEQAECLEFDKQHVGGGAGFSLGRRQIRRDVVKVKVRYSCVCLVLTLRSSPRKTFGEEILWITAVELHIDSRGLMRES